MRALLLIAMGLVAAGPARAADPPEGPALQIYLEPAKLAGTPWGGLLRLRGEAKGSDLSRGRALHAALEARLDGAVTELKSLTLTVPDLAAASGKSGWVLALEFPKPYDGARLAAVFGKAGLAADTSRPTLLMLRPAGAPAGPPPAPPAGHPLSVTIRPAALTPLAPKPDTLPPEFAVFKPLAEQKSLALTGDLGADGAMALSLSAPAATPEQAAALTTSLDVLRQVLRTVALGENAPAASQYGLRVDPVLVALQPAFTGARVETVNGLPRLTLSVKPDPAFLPALAGLYGVLGGELTPAQREMGQTNLKQIGLALHNYHDVHNGLPASAAFVGKDKKPLLSWRVAILPYIEQEALYKKFKLDEPWDSEHNLKVLRDNPMPDVFRAPGIDTPDKKTRLQGFVADPAGKDDPRPMFGTAEGVKLQDVTDGSSNTLLVTVAREPVEWTKPADIPFAVGADLRKLVHFGADGNGEAACVLGDGSVKVLRGTIKAKTFEYLVTRNDGMVIDLDD